MTAMSGRKTFVAPVRGVGNLGKILSVLALVGGIIFYLSADRVALPDSSPIGAALLACGLVYWYARLWLFVYDSYHHKALVRLRAK